MLGNKKKLFPRSGPAENPAKYRFSALLKVQLAEKGLGLNKTNQQFYKYGRGLLV